MDVSETGLQHNTEAPKRSRKVSPALLLGVLLMPAIFVWLLLRPGYSTRSQIAGVAWLGVIGLALLISAPHGRLTKASPAVSADSGARAWETSPTEGSSGTGAQALVFKLDRTRSVSQMLRTPVTLTNNVGRDLRYVEVFCSYYDAAGALLGYGISNWSKLKAGDTVNGEVVAAGVAIDGVRRRECRSRHL
jgi:hypothetical protein